MKKAVLFFFCLVFVACGGGGERFKLKGKFKNLNQGEFYVYGLDGGLAEVDTIRIERGRFVYETPCETPTTLILVFPNFSEQPIFAEPGASVEVKADASSLKELEAEGTDANELMTAFRKQTMSASPAEIQKLAEQFASDHLDSEASVYIVRRHLMQSLSPDYSTAERLLAAMMEKQPKNLSLKRLHATAKSLKNTKKGSAMPSFSGRDIDGKSVSSSTLKTARVSVVTTCASWHPESINQLRRLNRLRRNSGGRLQVMSVLLDGNFDECRNVLRRDSITCPVLFDSKFFDGNVVKQLGLSSIGDNVVFLDGRVVGNAYSTDNLIKEVESLLKK
ncbi:MAG: DUF4369 domain-containing protein [Prevotella sp.]|nr:DUF4369 domain-containing protein [Prevotella sp.]